MIRYTYGFDKVRSNWTETNTEDVANDSYQNSESLVMGYKVNVYHPNTTKSNEKNESVSIQNYTLIGEQIDHMRPNDHLAIENLDIMTIEDVIVVHEGDSDSNQCSKTITANDQPRIRSTNKREISDHVSDNDNGSKKMRSVRWRSESLFNNKYFTLLSKTKKRIEAKCMGCGKPLKGYGLCTSNVITHLKVVSVNNVGI